MAYIRDAVAGDAADLAGVYAEALPSDVLPRLGRNFLERVFFPEVLACPGAFTLAVDHRGHPGAFVVIAAGPRELTERLASHRMALLSALLRRLPADARLGRAIFDLLLRTKVRLFEDIGPLEARPELYVIAVAPTLQGQGTGSLLVQAAMERLDQECGAFPGCVVKTSSPEARRFYEKNCFRVIGREQRGCRALDILLRESG